MAISRERSTAIPTSYSGFTPNAYQAVCQPIGVPIELAIGEAPSSNTTAMASGLLAT